MYKQIKKIPLYFLVCFCFKSQTKILLLWDNCDESNTSNHHLGASHLASKKHHLNLILL